jgi:hypothetical protein
MAVLKSTKNNASGRNIVDEPKPAIVPISLPQRLTERIVSPLPL